MKRLLLPLLLTAVISCRQSFEVYDLTCEYLTEPLAIDNTQPHFSWKIRSDVPMEQAAYEIEVGPDSLWYSGKVESIEQIMIPYQGRELAPRQQAWWRVRIWRKGKNRGELEASAWSKPQRFGIGLLDGMKGEYIGCCPGEGRAPVFRKRFNAPKTGTQAILHVNSLGYHEAFVNGSKVTDAVLCPAVSQLDSRSIIVTYDVSSLLKEGENEITIYAGSGWYKKTTFGAVYDGPLVKAELDIDGKPFIWTDASWEGAWCGYSDLGTWQPHKFGGELIDARVEPEWAPVDVVSVTGIKATPQMCGPVKVQEELLPASITALEDGKFLLDYGCIVNAMMDVALPPLPAGTTVTATFSDFMHPDGSLEQATIGQDIYIASGAPEGDRFRNRFNHHLFQYILVEGLPQEPGKEAFKALRIGDDLVWGGSFKCSDPDLNAIYNLVERSVQNLTFGGYMVDCASIERLGYGGDGNASTPTLQAMADAAPLYLNWLQAWADSQRPDGGLPHTAPNPYTAGGGPYWCSFLIQAAYNTYLNYADPRPMERYYPAMKRWLEYVDKYSADGLLRRWPDTDYRSWYLGDWAAPKGIDVSDQRSIDLISNCTLLMVYHCMWQIAKALGKDAEVVEFADKRTELAKLIVEEFRNSDGTFASGSHTDNIIPIISGTGVSLTYFPPPKIAAGLVGIPVITEWAINDCLLTNWMYKTLKNRDYPGYLYMIDNGATGTWEEWNGGRSHLHNCYNGIGRWFFEGLGGISPVEPGYRKCIITPTLPDGVDWVEITQNTPYGQIHVFKSKTEFKVDVPVGITFVN